MNAGEPPASCLLDAQRHVAALGSRVATWAAAARRGSTSRENPRPSMASSGAWRVRRRSTGADDGAYTMNTLSLGDGPQTLSARPFVGRRGKRRKLVDVETTLGAGGPSADASSMFGEVVLEAEEEGNTETDPLEEYAGPALLCFLKLERPPIFSSGFFGISSAYPGLAAARQA